MQEHVAEENHECDPREAVERDEHDHGDVDHQPVGERVGDLAERRLDTPPSREPAVELIRDRGGPEHDPREPARATPLGEQQDDEGGDRGEAQDRERVRQLAKRRRDRRAHGSRLDGRSKIHGGPDDGHDTAPDHHPRVPSRPEGLHGTYVRRPAWS